MPNRSEERSAVISVAAAIIALILGFGVVAGVGLAWPDDQSGVPLVVQVTVTPTREATVPVGPDEPTTTTPLPPEVRRAVRVRILQARQPVLEKDAPLNKHGKFSRRLSPGEYDVCIIRRAAPQPEEAICEHRLLKSEPVHVTFSVRSPPA